MAALDLSAALIPGIVRKITLGVATHCRNIVLPTNLGGVKGGGLTISVYAVGTESAFLSPDVATPTEDAVYAGDSLGPLPAGTWSTIDWDNSHGCPAVLTLVAQTGAQVVYVAVGRARVPE